VIEEMQVYCLDVIIAGRAIMSLIFMGDFEHIVVKFPLTKKKIFRIIELVFHERKVERTHRSSFN